MRHTGTVLVLTKVVLLGVGGVVAEGAVEAPPPGGDGGSKRRSLTDLDLDLPKSRLLMSLKNCPSFLNFFTTEGPKSSLSSSRLF